MTPYKHQTDVFERAKDRLYYAMFLEQGTGKSKLGIDLVEYHFKKGDISACLIVTKKGLVGNWAYVELPKHSTVKHSIYVFRGTPQSIIRDRSELQYMIVNVDGTLLDDFKPLFKGFLKAHKHFCLLVDESTFGKNHKTDRSKRLFQLRDFAKYRYIFSGTPITNAPLDVYAQCKILDPYALGTGTFTNFKARYSQTIPIKVAGGRMVNKTIGWRNLDELTESIHEIGSVIKKKDCLDLPPKVYRTIPVPLTDIQRTHYDELKTRALTYIQGNEITVVNAISMINRLLQICSGQIKLQDGTYISLPNNRLDIVSDLVDEVSGKTIIWTAFVNNALDLEKKLKERAVLLPSGLEMSKRQKIIDSFLTGSYKVLIANPASAGHGITLNESSNVIYYSNSFNYEYRAQSEDRNHRIGQTKSVLYTDLISPDTIEGRVLEVLLQKREMSEQVLTSTYIKELLS